MISSIKTPDSQVTMFYHDFRDYTQAIQLCSYELRSCVLRGVSFNPSNWRQLCLLADKHLSVWNVEQSDDKYIMIKQYVFCLGNKAAYDVPKNLDLYRIERNKRHSKTLPIGGICMSTYTLLSC